MRELHVVILEGFIFRRWPINVQYAVIFEECKFCGFHSDFTVPKIFIFKSFSLSGHIP